MSTELERAEDLAGLDDTDIVNFEITETVTNTATVSMTVGELRAIAKHETARDRDHLTDVDGIRDALTERLAVMDLDDASIEHTFGAIEVA